MIDQLKNYQTWWGSLTKLEQTTFTRDLETNTEGKKKIRELYKFFYLKDVPGCGWCILSAHLELVKLNTDNMEKKIEYVLKAGAVLHDVVNKDFSKMLTPQRLLTGGEELALYHLATNKQAIRYFQRVPDDVDTRLAEYLAKCDSELASIVREAGANKQETLEAALAQAKATRDAAKQKYQEAEARVTELKAKLEEAEFLVAEDPKAELGDKTPIKDAIADANKPVEDAANETGTGEPQAGVTEGTVVVSPEGQGPTKDTDRVSENGSAEGTGDPKEPVNAPAPEIPGITGDDDGNPVTFDLDDEVKTLYEAGLNMAETVEALDENIKAKQTTKKAVEDKYRSLKAAASAPAEE